MILKLGLITKLKILMNEQNDPPTMTSSNGKTFRVTGHLCGEFTGHRWIPHIKSRDAELWCFFGLRLNKRLSKQSWGWWFETLSCPLWRHRTDKYMNCHYKPKTVCRSFNEVCSHGSNRQYVNIGVMAGYGKWHRFVLVSMCRKTHLYNKWFWRCHVNSWSQL